MLNPKVDKFIDRQTVWLDEFVLLREILLSIGLSEDLKWGNPCYTFEDKNIVLIHGFKEYCAILFFKGALLKDPEQLLIQQTLNVQAARQMRFTNVSLINDLKEQIRSYIFEAIEIEKAGLKVEFKQDTVGEIAELTQYFNDYPDVKLAFEKLTPGRQRAYLLFFSSAKQSKTKVARITKNAPRILEGLGLND